MVLGLLDGLYDLLVQPRLPDGVVATLDTGVLLGLSGFDVLNGDAQFLSPDQGLATDVVRAQLWGK